MIGIGVVYQAVVSGLITDDSELAVAMCPLTYRAQTVPLVRVRCVLYHAAARGLGRCDASIAFDSAKRIHFLERTMTRLAQAWRARVPHAADLLIGGLTTPDTDVKAADSTEAIRCGLQIANREGEAFVPTRTPRRLPLWS
jgi:hypothetical protein